MSRGASVSFAGHSWNLLRVALPEVLLASSSRHRPMADGLHRSEGCLSPNGVFFSWARLEGGSVAQARFRRFPSSSSSGPAGHFEADRGSMRGLNKHCKKLSFLTEWLKHIVTTMFSDIIHQKHYEKLHVLT